MDIAPLKILNILLALTSWAGQWATKIILAHNDNQAVVTVIQSGKTKDPTLAAFCLKADIRLKTVYISVKVNVIADSLSRFHM